MNAYERLIATTEALNALRSAGQSETAAYTALLQEMQEDATLIAKTIATQRRKDIENTRAIKSAERKHAQ